MRIIRPLTMRTSAGSFVLTMLAFSAAAVRDAAATPAAGGDVELLYHADLDGRLATPACGSGGRAAPDYAALVGAIDQGRADASAGGRGAPVVLLGGNQAAPDLFARGLLERGGPGAAALAALLARGGYDAVALGQHELSLDAAVLDPLLAALVQRGIPVVATNLRCAAGRRATCAATRPELLIRRGEAVVGLAAIISASVLPGIPAAARAGLSLDDAVAAARAAARRLRAQGAGRVVLMAQGPRDARALDEAEALARRLAEAPPEERPDVILAGGLIDEETDRALRLLRRDGAPPVVGSSAGAEALSQVTIAAASGAVSVAALPAAATGDVATAALLAPEVAGYCARYGVPVAPGPVVGTLTRDAFVTYVLEVMRRRAGAELALINRAFVKRAPFPVTGALTRAELYRALPYRAVLGVARVTGAAIDGAVVPALANPKLAGVGLGRAASGAQVNGRALDKGRAYRVATIAFVADGGDALLPAGALPWRPLAGAPDLRDAVEEFLRTGTALEDGDVTVDAQTDFGPPPARRPLVVAVSDVGLDLSDTSISNGPGYGDAQLARAQQTTVKGEATGLLQLRDPIHEADARLNLKYGWLRSLPSGGAATSAETTDLITFSAVYNYRGLRGARAVPARAIPDPYLRVGIESELTRPAVTATQTRDFHHLEMTDTAGALFTLAPKLRVRGGGGVRRELLAPGYDGRWRPLLEAGATLDPVAVATLGALAVRLEGLADYSFTDPAGAREHELRASAKLAVPLLPLLFVTAGVDVFAAQRQRMGWGAAYDTTVGLRVHLDGAYQRL